MTSTVVDAVKRLYIPRVLSRPVSEFHTSAESALVIKTWFPAAGANVKVA